MGTGVLSWENMISHYKSCFDIKKIVIMFISHDFTRDSWNFPEDQLNCINKNKL